MQHTHVDERIGQPTFAVNLQARPEKAVREPIAALQNAIQAEVPAGLFKCPPQTLHVTVFPVVWARGNYPFDVRQRWNDISAGAIEELKRVVSASSPFELTGASLETRHSAVILRFETDPVVTALRERISGLCLIEEMITQRPDLTHISLFRFETALPLPLVARVVAAHDVPELPWTVDRLVLCKEQTYPSLKSRDLAIFDMRG